MPEIAHEKCLHPERWTEVQLKIETLQRDLDVKLKAMQKSADDTKELMQDLHDRFFVDNGNPSFQSRLQTVEASIRLLASEPGNIANAVQRITKLELENRIGRWVIAGLTSVLLFKLAHWLFTLVEKA